MNPWTASARKKLTAAVREVTLKGGRVGSGQADDSTPEAVASDATDDFSGPDLAMSLAALLGMHQAYVARDRKELDLAYENLVTECEEYRDAVPKA